MSAKALRRGNFDSKDEEFPPLRYRFFEKALFTSPNSRKYLSTWRSALSRYREQLTYGGYVQFTHQRCELCSLHQRTALQNRPTDGPARISWAARRVDRLDSRH